MPHEKKLVSPREKSEKNRINSRRWQVICGQQSVGSDSFFYAVKTTGIYCRPGCASRLPSRKNVEFFSHAADAVDAGFRACLRCKPDSLAPEVELSDKIRRACRQIEESSDAIPLAALAKEFGYSPHHFHKQFKRITGVTPAEYAETCRFNRLREKLPEADSITEAIYDSGFGSSRRVYEKAAKELGMTPGEYKTGAHQKKILYTIEKSKLGLVLIAATDKGICRIDIDDELEKLTDDLLTQFPHARMVTDDSEFNLWVRQILAFIKTPNTQLDLPLDIRGTSFQRQVWGALQKIPAGKTETYGEIARQIGRPGAARAIANACANNPTALAIPCHRAVRSDGRGTAFRWGPERKLKILMFEKKSNS